LAIFLNWKDYDDGSKERFIISLFSSVSNRWYPPSSVVNATSENFLDTYDVFDVYSEEFYLANTEIDQTFDDLSIHSVRTSPVADRNFSKLYDNFGYSFETPKLPNQKYDVFNTGSVVQSYRQELRFLQKAYLEGTTDGALNNVGYAFMGIAPILEESVKEYGGWILTTYSGSVQKVGEDLIITNVDIPKVGNILKVSDPVFLEGDSFVYSFSKLGYNTKLSSKKNFNSRIKLTFYTHETGSTFKQLVEKNVKKLVRADIKPLIYYDDNFVFTRPSSSTIEDIVLNDVLTTSHHGYIYNTKRIFPTGSFYETDILELPSNYFQYDWFYDWMTNTINHGEIEVGIRSYSSGSIPDTVAYKRFTTEYPHLLTAPENAYHSHWIFNSEDTLWDIGVYGTSSVGNNLIIGSSSTFSYIGARDERRFSLKNEDDYSFSTSGSVGINFQGAFSCEIWADGIDTNGSNNLQSFSLTHTDGSGDDYYSIYFNGVLKRFGIDTSLSGASTGSFADIANYFDEDPHRFHYFALSYIPGRIFFYIDGKLFSEEEITLNMPDIPSSSIYVNCLGSGLAIDEILLSEGFLDEERAANNYYKSQPRVYRVGVPSDSLLDRYHQAKFTFTAYGEKEIEYHQFSMRGKPKPIETVLELDETGFNSPDYTGWTATVGEVELHEIIPI